MQISRFMTMPPLSKAYSSQQYFGNIAPVKLSGVALTALAAPVLFNIATPPAQAHGGSGDILCQIQSKAPGADWENGISQDVHSEQECQEIVDSIEKENAEHRNHDDVRGINNQGQVIAD